MDAAKRRCSLLLFVATPAEEDARKQAAGERGLPFDKIKDAVLGEYHWLGTVGDEIVIAARPTREGGRVAMGPVSPAWRSPAIGGEMEGVGLLAASARAEDPVWCVVKGISDFGDEDRDRVLKDARPVACLNAARFNDAAPLRERQPAHGGRVPLGPRGAAVLQHAARRLRPRCPPLRRRLPQPCATVVPGGQRPGAAASHRLCLEGHAPQPPARGRARRRTERDGRRRRHLVAAIARCIDDRFSITYRRQRGLL